MLYFKTCLFVVPFPIASTDVPVWWVVVYPNASLDLLAAQPILPGGQGSGVDPYTGLPNLAAPAPGLSIVGEFPLAATVLGLGAEPDVLLGGEVDFMDIFKFRKSPQRSLCLIE